MKSFGEIDLNETPIVVLGCGHFFTMETLDGHIGMTEVYTQDAWGKYTGLKDISSVLAGSVPRCPDCQCPVRQYCSNRFNRVINRAVIDEMSKRFLVSGKEDLRRLEAEVLQLEVDLEVSRDEIIRSFRQSPGSLTQDATPAESLKITRQLTSRYSKARKIEKEIEAFCRKVADKNQPVQKLHEATLTAARRKSIDRLMTDLSVTDSISAVPRDRRVTLGGRATQLQAECIILTDSISLAKSQNLYSRISFIDLEVPGSPPEKLAKSFFERCKNFIDECDSENLPRLGVEARLYYARVAQSYEPYCRSMGINAESASKNVKNAKELLQDAQRLCERSFENAKGLSIAVQQTMNIVGREWYEEVAPEELATIKNAMVSGSRGMSTHSGHWYNCANGHPVSCPAIWCWLRHTN